MANYRVVLARSGERDLQRLPHDLVDRVIKAIDRLSQNPRLRGVIKLQGRNDLWRIRVGDYRCIYRIDDKQRLVDVTHVRHRKEAYS